MLDMWPTWARSYRLSTGKRARGGGIGQLPPPSKLSPHTETVVVVTVKKSASMIMGKIGEVPADMMLDSGSAKCLVSQDIVLGMKATTKAALRVCPKLVTASGQPPWISGGPHCSHSTNWPIKGETQLYCCQKSGYPSNTWD